MIFYGLSWKLKHLTLVGFRGGDNLNKKMSSARKTIVSSVERGSHKFDGVISVSREQGGGVIGSYGLLVRIYELNDNWDFAGNFN